MFLQHSPHLSLWIVALLEKKKTFEGLDFILNEKDSNEIHDHILNYVEGERFTPNTISEIDLLEGKFQTMVEGQIYLQQLMN